MACLCDLVGGRRLRLEGSIRPNGQAFKTEQRASLLLPTCVVARRKPYLRFAGASERGTRTNRSMAPPGGRSGTRFNSGGREARRSGHAGTALYLSAFCRIRRPALCYRIAEAKSAKCELFSGIDARRRFGKAHDCAAYSQEHLGIGFLSAGKACSQPRWHASARAVPKPGLSV